MSKVALITGAASPIGMGARTGRRLAGEGWSVVLVDVDPRVHETAHALQEEVGAGPGRLEALVADVTDESQVDAAVGAACALNGVLDLVVANAGVTQDVVDLVDQTSAAFDHVIAVNLRGTFLTCRAAGRVMKASGRGSIITISSIFGQEPYPTAAAYSASKAGVIALTQSFAREMAPYGVRVNSIAPGYISTEMLATASRGRAARMGIDLAQEAAHVDSLIPLGRHGTADDIAGVIAFLASDEAGYITGHTLGVTGGVVMR
jgi:NAD(P)-dependent dehydrogenase (short-subunit alcohol dehydrogenase family)